MQTFHLNFVITTMDHRLTSTRHLPGQTHQMDVIKEMS
jgi:hypothetical protein